MKLKLNKNALHYYKFNLRHYMKQTRVLVSNMPNATHKWKGNLGLTKS